MASWRLTEQFWSLVTGLLVFALSLGGCGYSPHFVSGVTRCANAEPLCPSGFTCDTAAGVCVTSDAAAGSDAPADHAGDTGTGGGDGGANDTPASDSATDGAADTRADATCTADIATSPDNCGACGHSCGGGLCDRGVCQAMVVPGVAAATSLSVDATQLYFTSGTKILACPKSGCVLQPAQLDDMGATGYSTWAVVVTNGTLFFMSAPTQAGTEHDDLFMCPLAGCPSPAPIIASAIYGVSYLANAGNDVYWSDAQARKTYRRACLPNNGGCDPIVTIMTEAIDLNLLTAAGTGSEFYFVDAAGLQKCPNGGCPVAPAMPTLLSATVPTGVVYYGGLVYMQFGDAQHTLNGAIRTCNPVDCDGQVPKSFIANRDPISGLTVDAQGVYWIEDATIYSCPRTGCVGGARTVASGLTQTTTPSFNAHPIVTDDAFIYWINDAVGTVKRIAK